MTTSLSSLQQNGCAKPVAIVGAGPAGLATARALGKLGIACDIFERHTDVGGIWSPGNVGSPMYESAHFISSKTMSGFSGYPMSDAFPDYPSNRQIAEYLTGFAEKYNLRERIHFGMSISAANYEHGTWTLKTNKGERGGYGWLVCANGTNWFPRLPELPGQDVFGGEIMHSSKYHSAEAVRGKRVMIVGAGNSGVDIACDAASSASAAFMSLRRGYYFLPKHMFGMPIDVFGQQSAWMPLWVQRLSTGILLHVLLGNLQRLGLPKPGHKLLESHPIVNSQIIHYLQHGRIKVKPDVVRLESDGVLFKDGSREKIDHIILATGYRHSIPYLPDGTFDFAGDHPRGFMCVFNPRHPEIFLNGFIETNAGAYPFFEKMAQMIARGIQAQVEAGPEWQRLKSFVEGPEPNLTRGIRYIESPRHAEYINAEAYTKQAEKLRKMMGWPSMAEEWGA